MKGVGYPRPGSHKTFQFDAITFDSNFDSGNCRHVDKISHSTYDIWIEQDHLKKSYRTWFYFSVSGFGQGSTVSFNIKNMQNQSKLLSEGLVPVFRQENSADWKRIKERINLSNLNHTDAGLEWNFKHTFTSSQKVFLAMFYPWSNDQNAAFMTEIEANLKNIPNSYFYRGGIINTLQGRKMQMMVISSNLRMIRRQQKLKDASLFSEFQKPNIFHESKKGIVLSSRVHPGQVPGSFVLNGILEVLMSESQLGTLMRDNFVFYVFPILNPDGVARGHYRVDTNGINLNRCYINPSQKFHPTIYAIKQMIMHLHNSNRFYAFLDLHAHASRKGTFIYGNSLNQLQKQVDTCFFPKILSLNSPNFEYEGSNFTQQNMYCKDGSDHMSKEGSGRVALYKATKNPHCWTLECNYNMGRVVNVLEPTKNTHTKALQIPQQNWNKNIIFEYREPNQKLASEFFTIDTYKKLGNEICYSFLDLINKNPWSRIDNPSNYYQTIHNLRLNLSVSLLRMAPNRFEASYRKIYTYLNCDNKQFINRALQALYFLLVKIKQISNVQAFIKDGDLSVLSPENPKKAKSLSAVQPVLNQLLHRGSLKQSRISDQMDIGREKASSEMKKRSIGKINLKNDFQNMEQSVMLDRKMETERLDGIIYQKLKQYSKQVKSSQVNTINLQVLTLLGVQKISKNTILFDRASSPNKKEIQKSRNTGIFQRSHLPSLTKKIPVKQSIKKLFVMGDFVEDKLF